MAAGHLALRRGLVVAEVAICFILLSGAALLLQTLWHVEYDHLGFQPEHLYRIAIPLQRSRVTNDDRKALADDVLSRLRDLPGTVAASVGECTRFRADR